MRRTAVIGAVSAALIASGTVIGVVVRTYDGAGTVHQVDNIKGSVTGIVPDRPGDGTYQVNEDCSGVTLFQPGPGITLEERMVIVDHGNEIRTIVSSPADCDDQHRAEENRPSLSAVRGAALRAAPWR